MRIKTTVLSFFALPAALLITGCGMGVIEHPISQDTPELGAPMSGSVFGGRQPISGAHIYMYAAGTSGYGGASVSLMNNYPGGAYPSTADGNGNYYVTTNSNGIFQLAAGEYSCTVGQAVYVYSISGNPGTTTGSNNTAAGLMSVLGTCASGGNFRPQPANTGVFVSNVNMSEVSTVAAAYAMSGFAVDATDVSTSGTALAITGVQNAFYNASMLYNINSANGAVALTSTPNGNGTVPQAELISLANSLAACVNSDGATSPGCSSLFSNSKSSGSSGTTPTDTATAAINITHNPANAVSTIYFNGTSTPPYGGALSSAPNDWTIGITYSDSSFVNPYGIAIDGSGNAWVSNSSPSNALETSLAEISPTGVILSGPGQGYYSTDMSGPYGLAIDTSGNAWTADKSGYLIEIASDDSFQNEYPGLLSGATAIDMTVAIDPYKNLWVGQNTAVAEKFSSTGTNLLATSGGGMNGATGVASDASGNVYFSNSDISSGRTNTYGDVSVFNNAGTALSGTPYGASLHQLDSTAVAIDYSGNFWSTNYSSNSLTELASGGTAVGGASPTTGNSVFIGGGLSHPTAIAFDGNSYAWIANNTGSLSEFASSGGIPATGGSGYTSYGTTLSGISGIAVDGSGDVWVPNYAGNTVIEFIGVATPVVTPLAAAIASTGGYGHAAVRP